jgi:hypothetical protein
MLIFVIVDFSKKTAVMFGMSLKGRIALSFACSKRACHRLARERIEPDRTRLNQITMGPRFHHLAFGSSRESGDC